jgi:hypothetical protein
MSLHELDSEIRQIEARIAAERLTLEEAINDSTRSLRDAVTSPKALLALTGASYAVGKLMFGRKKPEPAPSVAKKAGILGVLTGVAGTAFGLMQPRFGAGSVARWAANRYFASRAARRAAASPAATSSVFPAPASSPPPPRAISSGANLTRP